MRRLPVMAGIVSILTLCAAASAADADIEAAKAFFERYVNLSQAFDVALADLYADEALIRNLRRQPNGEVRTMTMPGAQYKQLIRVLMPLAEMRRDISRFADVEYTLEAGGVRITATRYAELERYASPFSLLLCRNPEGVWLICEETSESRP